ncbi:MAG: SDR family NAD(P)-dependent oxidoreductase [Actinomycetota bacterium]|nr:SDR family NAD(P)-dependent oxidoreductase [Actinomycetota bacterium]
MHTGAPRIDGARVVVTGATSGLGAAMATALVAAGAAVGVAARPGHRLAESVTRLRGQGSAVEIPVDVRDADSVTLAVREAIVRLGGVDMVINNAGIGMRTVNPRFFEHPQPFFEVGPAAFDDVVATNLRGYFLVARAFAFHFLEQGKGRFVNVSVNEATMGRRGFVPYGPSRAATESLSAIMTEDLRPYGIAVNVLLPGGATQSGMIPDELPEDRRAALLPAGIMGPPAVFLASSEADGLTGARIVAKEFGAWLAAYRAQHGAGRTGAPG